MNDSAPLQQLPTVAGALYDGGIYASRYFIGTDAFALIVSPKAEGDLKPPRWGPLRKKVDGALSYADGRANTAAMLAAGSMLAEAVRALRIGGHDDWYLPSQLESLLAFGELKGTPAFDFELDWYWTSTQYASYPDYAWCQGFDNGNQTYDTKNGGCRARAVRRVPLR